MLFFQFGIGSVFEDALLDFRESREATSDSVAFDEESGLSLDTRYLGQVSRQPSQGISELMGLSVCNTTMTNVEETAREHRPM